MGRRCSVGILTTEHSGVLFVNSVAVRMQVSIQNFRLPSLVYGVCIHVAALIRLRSRFGRALNSLLRLLLFAHNSRPRPTMAYVSIESDDVCT